MIRMKSIPRILTLATTILFSVVSQAQIYVSIEGRGDGSSWENTTTLSEALNRARAGEQIWVKGYEDLNEERIYTPDNREEGFRVKSGVRLYGGFAGTETSIDERETLDFPYRLKYRSILSGDIAKNDTLDAVNLIFPGNGTRDERFINRHESVVVIGQQQLIPNGCERLYSNRGTCRSCRRQGRRHIHIRRQQQRRYFPHRTMLPYI